MAADLLERAEHAMTGLVTDHIKYVPAADSPTARITRSDYGYLPVVFDESGIAR